MWAKTYLSFFAGGSIFLLVYKTFLIEQVIDGLDRAVMIMKKGEVALLTIATAYVFGSSESQHQLGVVPPNSTVYYEVELDSFDKAS